MRWIEVSVDTPAELIDERCQQMADMGADGFVIENEADFQDFLNTPEKAERHRVIGRFRRANKNIPLHHVHIFKPRKQSFFAIGQNHILGLIAYSLHIPAPRVGIIVKDDGAERCAFQ